MVLPRITHDARRMLHGNPDQRIHELAAGQRGVFTRDQLLGAGVSEGSIDHRLKKRTFRPVHRGGLLHGARHGPLST